MSIRARGTAAWKTIILSCVNVLTRKHTQQTCASRSQSSTVCFLFFFFTRKHLTDKRDTNGIKEQQKSH